MFRELSDSVTPPASDCHVRWRIEKLLGNADGIRALLNFDTPIPHSRRLEELRKLVVEELLPIVANFSTVEFFRSEEAQQYLARSLILPDARELLGSVA
jgi:hypothetical protein